MRELKDVLKPISGDHSIKEAVITLFLSSPIIKPDRFETLIMDKFKNRFQRFEAINQVKFQFKGTDGGHVESEQPQIEQNIGFKFQRFEEGKTVVVLQGINELFRNFISYHSLNYSDWDVFYLDFLNDIKEVSSFHANLFINALSLHYIDEFIWEGESDIDTKRVFNERSTLLPAEFFVCKLSNYQFTTIKKTKVEYFDRLEIKVEERPKKFITISHNVIQNLNDSADLKELLMKPDLKEILDEAHKLNKKALLNILSKDVCDLIKIKP